MLMKTYKTPNSSPLKNSPFKLTKKLMKLMMLKKTLLIMLTLVEILIVMVMKTTNLMSTKELPKKLVMTKLMTKWTIWN